MSSPLQTPPIMSSAYPLLGEFEVAITGGVWVAAGGLQPARTDRLLDAFTVTLIVALKLGLSKKRILYSPPHQVTTHGAFFLQSDSHSHEEPNIPRYYHQGRQCSRRIDGCNHLRGQFASL